MIDRREILDMAGTLGLLPHVVEKDYVLGWVLAGIYRQTALAERWIFKGGTCLKKCYFETTVSPKISTSRSLIPLNPLVPVGPQAPPTRGATPAAPRARRPARRVPPVDYRDKLPPSPWDTFAPPRRYIFTPPLTYIGDRSRIPGVPSNP